MATKAERETIINFVEGDETARVFTCNRKLQNRLANYEIEPEETDAATGGKSYTVPRNYVRIQRPAAESRVWTEEAKQAARERLAGVREVRAAERAKAAKAAGKPTVAAKTAVKPVAPAETAPSKPQTAAERLRAKTAARAAAAPAAEVEDEETEEAVEVVTPKAKGKK